MDEPKKFSNKIIYTLCAVLILYGMFLFSVSGYTSMREANGNKDLPEESFAMKPEEFYGFLDKIGAQGRKNYLVFQALDYGNAILLSVLLFFVITNILVRINAGEIAWAIRVFPVAMGLTDITENTLQIILTINYPKHLMQLASVCEFVTSAKLVFGMFSFLSLIFGALIILGRALLHSDTDS